VLHSCLSEEERERERERERCTMTLSSRALAWDLGDADRLEVVVSLRSCVCVKGELVPVRKRFVIVEDGK
jgi:hypothetical protein